MGSPQLDEEAIFHVARKIGDPIVRSNYLDQACGSVDLRWRVEALLEVHEKEEGFLKSAGAYAPTVEQPAINGRAGQQISGGVRKELAVPGFKLLRELGRGSIAAVYLAASKESGQHVALKLMLPRVAVEDRAKDLFLRESENTKALNHPNVVQLHQSGSCEGILYFTLEFCAGGSVHDLVKQRGGRLPLDEAGKIAVQALNALEYAHNAIVPNVRLANGSYRAGRGLVHRDVKPQNIFLSGTPDATVKVGDFGLAKAFEFAGLSGHSDTGNVCGTLQFMSRQQIINSKYAKPDVDVWALAASFYFMITGRHARDFPQGITVVEALRLIRESEPIPVRRRDATVPKRVAEVIDYALRDNPEIGVKSANELKALLLDVL